MSPVQFFISLIKVFCMCLPEKCTAKCNVGDNVFCSSSFR